ncbi:MAG: hypothetical protein RBU30_19280 [Polyangia bacterium]|nr:hypothetical protein [Polyangia bacterium]
MLALAVALPGAALGASPGAASKRALPSDLAPEAGEALGRLAGRGSAGRGGAGPRQSE